MHGIDTDEEITYWRERAKNAEQQLTAANVEIEKLRATFNNQLPKSAWVTELYRLQDENERLRELLAAALNAKDAACDIADGFDAGRLTCGGGYAGRIAELRIGCGFNGDCNCQFKE